MDNKKIIGSRINSALAMNNTLQKELAKQLNVKDNIVSYWCKGDRTPNTSQIIQIANYLNVSTDYLLGITDVATTDKDLKFVCDYTGLDEIIINFFANNKDLNNNNFEVVEFIKFIISKIILNDDYIFSLNLEEIRDKTSWLFNLYVRNYTLFDTDSENFNINYEYYKEKAEHFELFVNGSKYKLNNYLTKWVDEFALTNIEKINIENFESLKNEFFKNNLTEN